MLTVATGVARRAPMTPKASRDYLVLVTAEDGEDVGTYGVFAPDEATAIDAGILYARANGFRACAGELAEA